MFRDIKHRKEARIMGDDIENDFTASVKQIRPLLQSFVDYVRALDSGEFSRSKSSEQLARERLEEIRKNIDVWAGAFGLDLGNLSLEEVAEYVQGLIGAEDS